MEKRSVALTDDSRQPSSVTHHPHLVHQQASPAASPALFAVSTIRSDIVSVSFTRSYAGWSLSGASCLRETPFFFFFSPSVSNQGSRWKFNVAALKIARGEETISGSVLSTRYLRLFLQCDGQAARQAARRQGGKAARPELFLVYSGLQKIPHPKSDALIPSACRHQTSRWSSARHSNYYIHLSHEWKTMWVFVVTAFV